MNKKEVEEAKNKLMTRKPDPIAPTSGLSTGSTLLNLACSGRYSWGIPKGKLVSMVGDSSTRKTWLCMTLLAEACKNKEFDDYQLVFNNAEHGALMDMRKYFGKALLDRIEIRGSSLQEEFYDDVDDTLDKGPSVYVLDSMDAIVPEAFVKQVEKEKKARKADKEASGSYATDKAKINSSRLRVTNNKVSATDSILVIIGQTRHNIGFGATFNPKTRSGGDAIKFYSRLECWLSLKETIKIKHAGKERPAGQKIRFKFTKNHICGWEGGKIDITFYRRTGLDDIGSCIDWLVEEGHWKESRGSIIAPELDLEGSREKLVCVIEELEGREKILKETVRDVWKDIEEGVELQRKRRYE